MKLSSRNLLEFIIIFVLLAVLGFAALDVMTEARARANNEVRKVHLAQLETALEQFYVRYGAYPAANAPSIDGSGSRIAELSSAGNMLETLIDTELLTEIPIDPEPQLGYIYLVADDDNAKGGKKNQHYALMAKMEGKNQKEPFHMVGRNAHEFLLNSDEWQLAITLGDKQAIQKVESIRKENALTIAPDGGSGIFWH